MSNRGNCASEGSAILPIANAKMAQHLIRDGVDLLSCFSSS